MDLLGHGHCVKHIRIIQNPTREKSHIWPEPSRALTLSGPLSFSQKGDSEAMTAMTDADPVDARPHTPLWTLKACQLLGSAAWACFGRFINVFWSDIGVTRTEVGILSLSNLVAAFIGQLFWSMVTDRLGEYKRVLVGTSLAGTVIIFFNMVPAVQSSFWLLAAVSVSSSFFLSTGGPIIDAMCVSVLKEQESEEQYGDQRLWCAVGWGGMSLIAGQLIDTFGISFMFWGFASIQSMYLSVCLFYMPMAKDRGQQNEQTVSLKQFLTFDVAWFFANLFVYGLAMSVVENFLLVFLNEDFDNTPKLLLGASTAMMCFFEVPVFKYVEKVWANNKDRLTSVLMACKVVLAFRCICYTLLPASNPWLVLLIEPLHGFTFAVTREEFHPPFRILFLYRSLSKFHAYKKNVMQNCRVCDSGPVGYMKMG